MRSIREWPVRDGVVHLAGPRDGSRIVTVAAAPQPIAIDLERTALVVVDMQNDFCTPGGWLASIGVDVAPALTPVAAIATLLDALRPRDVPVIWLNWANRPDRANLPPNVIHVYDPFARGGGIGDAAGRSEAVLTEGSWGAAIVPALSVAERDIHVGKYRMSGFWDTPLDSILRFRRIDTVLFAGVNADQCVLATLIDAACLGYDCVMVDDAVATTSPAFCLDATVYNVRQCFGFTALSADIAAAVQREEPPTAPEQGSTWPTPLSSAAPTS